MAGRNSGLRRQGCTGKAHVGARGPEAIARFEPVIWLKQGVVDDFTDGHIDLLAALVKPGVVLALGCADSADANYAAIQENLEILRGARDAKGRAFEVIEVPQPPAAWNEATGTRLGLSHLNFYLANGGLILPDFGDRESDAAALGLFREVFKDMEIVQVPSRDLLYAGGNIHCITQQEPVALVDDEMETSQIPSRNQDRA